MFSRVVRCPRPGEYSSAISANTRSCAAFSTPAAIFTRNIWNPGCRCPYVPCFNRKGLNCSGVIAPLCSSRARCSKRTISASIASRLCRSSISVRVATLMILGSQMHVSEKSSTQKTKKPTYPGALACGLRNFMIQLQLSPETPLARDGARATRSVAQARTTHHLATVRHEIEGYFPGGTLVKGSLPEKIRCIPFKKVINSKRLFLRLPGLLRHDYRGRLDGIQLRPSLVKIRLALGLDL